VYLSGITDKAATQNVSGSRQQISSKIFYKNPFTPIKYPTILRLSQIVNLPV
jgi:hypothetical protein